MNRGSITRISVQGFVTIMSEIVRAILYFCILLSPCLVATTCASERRLFKRRGEKPYDGPERRDPR